MTKSKNLDAILVVRLPAWAKNKLEGIAHQKGLNVSTLARMWLLEKLQSLR